MQLPEADEVELASGSGQPLVAGVERCGVPHGGCDGAARALQALCGRPAS